MHNPHLFPTEPRIDLQLGFRTAPKYKVIRVGKKLILSDFLSIRNETEIGKVSGIRESNPPPRLGKPVHYRCANSACMYFNNFVIMNFAFVASLFKEPIPGLEPGTYALRMRCSTN